MGAISLLLVYCTIVYGVWTNNYNSRIAQPIIEYSFTEGQLVNSEPLAPAIDVATYPSLNMGTLAPTAAATWLQDTVGMHIDDVVAGDRLVSSKDATKLVGAVQGSNDMTIELWIRLNDLLHTGIIMTLGHFTTDGPDRVACNDVNFSIEQDQGALYAYISAFSTTARCNPIGSVLLDDAQFNLIHLVVVRSGNSLLLYTNGTALAGGPASGNYTKWNSTYSLYFGPKLATTSWNGNIYLAAVYNRSLSETEIMTNYYAGLPDSRPLTRNSISVGYEDTNVSVALVSTDADGDPISLYVTSLPSLAPLTSSLSHHVLTSSSLPYTVANGETFTYLPPPYANGAALDSFTFRVNTLL
jgi:hypothetical protein